MRIQTHSIVTAVCVTMIVYLIMKYTKKPSEKPDRIKSDWYDAGMRGIDNNGVGYVIEFQLHEDGTVRWRKKL